MNQELEDLYQKYWKVHAEMIESGYTPLQIAGILTAHAMSIYKTVLSAEEFEIMIDSVSDSRNKVQKITKDITLQ